MQRASISEHPGTEPEPHRLTFATFGGLLEVPCLSPQVSLHDHLVFSSKRAEFLLQAGAEAEGVGKKRAGMNKEAVTVCRRPKGSQEDLRAIVPKGEPRALEYCPGSQ